MQAYPCLLGDVIYPLQTYLMKNFKDRCDRDKVRFNNLMNHGHVSIENAFGSLKKWWHILKNPNCRVYKGGKIIMAHCFFHNFCQLMNMPRLMVCDVQQKKDPLVSFHGQCVPIYGKGDVAKEASKVIHNILFASWLEHNPIV